MGKIRNLSGEKFGNLTVVAPTTKRLRRRVVWECICECGNTTFAIGDELQSGRRKSCGCLSKNSSCGKSFANFYEKGSLKETKFKVSELKMICEKNNYDPVAVGNEIISIVKTYATNSSNHYC